MSFLDAIFGGKQSSVGDGIKTPLDLVTYAASLGSNQNDIGPMLDKVRSITAPLGPGQAPSPEDDKRLLDVYLQLEEYLVTKEPLRSFSREELRKRISGPLLAQLTAHETKQNI